MDGPTGTLYDQFYTNAKGTDSLNKGAQAFKKFSETFEHLNTSLTKDLAGFKANFEGSASEAMGQAFKPLISDFGKGRDLATKAAHEYERQAEHFNTTKPKIQKAVDVPPPGFWDGKVPWNTDHDDAKEKNNEVTTGNEAAYGAYKNNTRITATALPVFDPNAGNPGGTGGQQAGYGGGQVGGPGGGGAGGYGGYSGSQGGHGGSVPGYTPSYGPGTEIGQRNAAPAPPAPVGGTPVDHGGPRPTPVGGGLGMPIGGIGGSGSGSGGRLGGGAGGRVSGLGGSGSAGGLGGRGSVGGPSGGLGGAAGDGMHGKPGTAAGKAGAPGQGGMGGGGRGGSQGGDDDYEHETASYLQGEHLSEIVGDLPPTPPAVIGG
ncbi:hypothetical protein D5S17_02250 [Pseudonocardiaceae bacterium YIM PH 21723]|nr:hypothetical protein D5S17_02250 [Pseudonocardiaceae bacterium YIM PH 21723]